jgi:hypothetical protein
MPGTAPTGWQNPKTSYTAEDVLTPEQFERIEGNAYATELGARTIDPSQSPTGVIGHLRNFLDWFANRIHAITGTTNWYDAPPTTLTAAKSHIDAAAPHSGHATTAALTAHTSAAAPHSGHETPSGAQAKVDTHASKSAPHSGHATTTALNNHTSATDAHSATSAATANRIIRRDTAGRAKVAAPSASDDIARKDTVDVKFHQTTGHKHTGVAGDGPRLVTGYRLGDTLIHSNDAEVLASGDTVAKQIVIGFPGYYRVKFKMRSPDGSTARAQVRVQGQTGTNETTSSMTYYEYSRDFGPLMPGDILELYAVTAAWLKDFRLYGEPVLGFENL